MPTEFYEWELVKETGWTLEYVRALPIQEFYNFLQIRDAKNKAQR